MTAHEDSAPLFRLTEHGIRIMLKKVAELDAVEPPAIHTTEGHKLIDEAIRLMEDAAHEQ